MKNYEIIVMDGTSARVQADFMEMNGDYVAFYITGRGMVTVFHKPLSVQWIGDIEED